MTTTKTRDELVAMAADELVIVGTGQSLESEDQEKIDSRFDGLMAELAVRDICYIASDDEIPIEWTGCLALLLANECAGSFGKPKMDDMSRRAIEDRLQVMVKRNLSPNRFLKVDKALRGGGHYTLDRWANDN